MNIFLAIGLVVLGTFIPAPQQAVVRNLSKAGWDWVKNKVGDIKFG